MKRIKTMIIAVIGVTLILIGVVLLVLPGPGLLLIAGGIGILALEFAWARQLLNKLKEKTGIENKNG